MGKVDMQNGAPHLSLAKSNATKLKSSLIKNLSFEIEYLINNHMMHNMTEVAHTHRGASHFQKVMVREKIQTKFWKVY